MVVMRDVPARTQWKRSRNRLKKMIRLKTERARAKASFNNGREPWRNAAGRTARIVE